MAASGSLLPDWFITARSLYLKVGFARSFQYISYHVHQELEGILRKEQEQGTDPVRLAGMWAGEAFHRSLLACCVEISITSYIVCKFLSKGIYFILLDFFSGASSVSLVCSGCWRELL